MIHTAALLNSISLKMKIFLGILLVASLTVAAGVAYHWYNIYQAKNSQIFLSDCLSEYQQIFESKDPAWQDMVMMADLAREQVSFEPYKPYLLVIKAQGYAQQGNITDAIATMDEVLVKIPVNSPYKHEYMLTRALMQLDAQENSVQERGLAQLQELSKMEQPFQDAALYYLAHYYRTYGNQSSLASLLQDIKDKNFADSPWIAKLTQEFGL